MNVQKSQLISIQLGYEANCVGAQFWNSQYISETARHERIDSSSLFQEVENGVLVPRLVSFTWSAAQKTENFSSSTEADSLQNNTDVTWSGPINKVFRQPFSAPDASTADLSRNVICPLNQNTTIYTPWNINDKFLHFSQGYEVYEHGVGEEFSDCVRRQLESCDHVGGFQFIIDAMTSFAGFASASFFALKDEFGCRVPCVLFGCEGNTAPKHEYNENLQLSNEARLLSAVIENDFHYVPLHGWKDNMNPALEDQIWTNWASDLIKCVKHYHSCTCSALAMDTFYMLLHSFPSKSYSELINYLQPKRNLMSFISFVPILRSLTKYSQLESVIVDGFRDRKYPPLYSCNGSLNRYSIQHFKGGNSKRLYDTGIFLIRGSEWETSIGMDSRTNKQPSNVIKETIETTIHECYIREPDVLAEPLGYRRNYFSEALPLELIGEVISTSSLTSQYYKESAVLLKEMTRIQRDYDQLERNEDIEKLFTASDSLNYS